MRCAALFHVSAIGDVSKLNGAPFIPNALDLQDRMLPLHVFGEIQMNGLCAWLPPFLSKAFRKSKAKIWSLENSLIVLDRGMRLRFGKRAPVDIDHLPI